LVNSNFPRASRMQGVSLRAIAYKYGESLDRPENSDFLLLPQKDPFGELFSEVYFKSFGEFLFL